MPIYQNNLEDHELDDAYLNLVSKPTNDEVGADIELHGLVPVTTENATQDPFTQKGSLANALDELSDATEHSSLSKPSTKQTYNSLPELAEVSTGELTGETEGVSNEPQVGEDKAVSAKESLASAFDEAFAMDGAEGGEVSDADEESNEAWIKKELKPPRLPDELKDEDKPDANGLVYITRTFTVDPAKYISTNYRPYPASQKPIQKRTVGGDTVTVEEVTMEEESSPDAKFSAKMPDEPTDRQEAKAAKEADRDLHSIGDGGTKSSKEAERNDRGVEKGTEDTAPDTVVLDYATYIDGSSFCCSDEVSGIDYSKIAMDAGPKKKVTRENCQTTFAQCRAKNPLFCRFHGPKLLEADIKTAIKATVGYGVYVNVTRDTKAKDKFTFRLTVGCTPAQKPEVERHIHRFMTQNPGIKSKEDWVEVGKHKQSTDFDMDILRADQPPKGDRETRHRNETKKNIKVNKKMDVVEETAPGVEKAAGKGIKPADFAHDVAEEWADIHENYIKKSQYLDDKENGKEYQAIVNAYNTAYDAKDKEGLKKAVRDLKDAFWNFKGKDPKWKLPKGASDLPTDEGETEPDVQTEEPPKENENTEPEDGAAEPVHEPVAEANEEPQPEATEAKEPEKGESKGKTNRPSEKSFHTAAMAINNAGLDVYDDAISSLAAIVDGKMSGLGSMSADDMVKETATEYIDALEQDEGDHSEMISALKDALAKVDGAAKEPQVSETKKEEPTKGELEEKIKDTEPMGVMEVDEPPKSSQNKAEASEVMERIEAAYKDYVEEPVPGWVNALSDADKEKYADLLEAAQNEVPSENDEDSNETPNLDALTAFEKEHENDTVPEDAEEKPAVKTEPSPETSLEEKKAKLKGFKHGQKCFMKGADISQQITFLKDNGDGTAEVQVKTPGANIYMPHKVEKKTVSADDIMSTGINQFGGVSSSDFSGDEPSEVTDETIAAAAGSISKKKGYPEGDIAKDIKERLDGKKPVKRAVLDLIKQNTEKGSPLAEAFQRLYDNGGWKADGDDVDTKLATCVDEATDAGMSDESSLGLVDHVLGIRQEIMKQKGIVEMADKEMKALADKFGEKAAMKTLKQKLLKDTKDKALDAYYVAIDDGQEAAKTLKGKIGEFKAEQTDKMKGDAANAADEAVKLAMSEFNPSATKKGMSPSEQIGALYNDFNNKKIFNLPDDHEILDTSYVLDATKDAGKAVQEFNNAMHTIEEKINSAETFDDAKGLEEVVKSVKESATKVAKSMQSLKAQIKAGEHAITDMVETKKKAEALKKKREEEKMNALKEKWNSLPESGLIGQNEGDFAEAFGSGDYAKAQKIYEKTEEAMLKSYAKQWDEGITDNNVKKAYNAEYAKAQANGDVKKVKSILEKAAIEQIAAKTKKASTAATTTSTSTPKFKTKEEAKAYIASLPPKVKLQKVIEILTKKISSNPPNVVELKAKLDKANKMLAKLG